MKHIGAARTAAIALGILAGSAGLVPPASASLFTIDVTQQGSNVVATGSGSIDLTGLTFDGSGDLGGSFTEPTFGVLVVGPAQITAFDSYRGITAPGSLGPGALGGGASSGSGDLVGPDIAGPLPVLIVPKGYASGDLLSDSAAWDSTTLSILGLTPGTYTYTWDSGADSLAINIGVPEPASLTLLASALFGLGLVRRRKTRLRHLGWGKGDAVPHFVPPSILR